MRFITLSLLFVGIALSISRGANAQTDLFNGRDLDNWEIVNNGQFVADDGVLKLNRGTGW